MATQKTLRGIKYADRLGPSRRVGSDLFQSDFATIQQAHDDLPATGGTIVLAGQTFSIATTITISKPIQIIGQGRGITIIDIGANVIDAFTITTDDEFSFSHFSVRAGNVAGQRCFRRTIAASFLEKKTVVECVEIGGVAAGDEFEEIFSNSASGRYIVSDCSMRTRAAAAARIFDGAGSLEVHNSRHVGEGGITGSPTVTLSDLTSFQIGATMALGADSYIDNCVLAGSVAGGLTDTVVTASTLQVTGSSMTSFAFTISGASSRAHFIGNGNLSSASSARVIDIAVTATLIAIGNSFSGGSSEAIRIASAIASIVADNKGCEVTEIGAADNNRYANNTGFDGSTIIGADSVVDDANTRLVTTTPVTLDRDDRTVRVDAATAGGDVTLDLPTAASARYQKYTVIKIDSGSNLVIIDPNGAETINGLADLRLSTQYDHVTIQSNGSLWEVVGSINGLNYLSALSSGRSTTTSSTFQTKTTLNAPALRGTYRIAWHAVIDNEGDLGEFRLRNTTDGANVGALQIFKPTDAAEREDTDGAGEVVFAGVAKSFEIQWRDQSGGNVEGIQDARIEVWRVA